MIHKSNSSSGHLPLPHDETVGEYETFEPPDGGKMANFILMSCFLVNGIIFGSLNTFGVFYVYMKEVFKEDSEASSKISLVGSLAIGATFLFSPVSGILTDAFGLRQTALLGASLAFLGMTLSATFITKLEALYFTYFIFGVGASLIYTPSLVILGHYFKRHLGLVNGIVTCGSSIFTIIMPHILKCLLQNIGLQGTFYTLAASSLFLVLASLLFKPLVPTLHSSRKELSRSFNCDIWKNKKYIIWCLSISSALFGYFVPYVHIVQYVKDLNPEYDGGILLTCIGLTSGLGRMFFGKLADYPNTNRILLQQISFICIGTCTMLLTLAPFFENFEFTGLILLSLCMGFFDGCFISLLGPIAFDICGPQGASQAIGFLLGFCSIPLTAGPPAAGYIYDQLGSYKIPFIVSGIPPIIGGLLLTLMYITQTKKSNDEEIQISDKDTNCYPPLCDSMTQQHKK